MKTNYDNSGHRISLAVWVMAGTMAGGFLWMLEFCLMTIIFGEHCVDAAILPA